MIRRLLFLGLTSAACCAGQDPRTVATAALAAWSNRDVDALVALTHPDLKQRLRDGPSLTEHVTQQRREARSLQTIAAGRSALLRESVAMKDRSALSDRDVMSLICELLARQPPRSLRVTYTDQWVETHVARDVAVVVFETIARSHADTFQTRRSNFDVLLKKHEGEWRCWWLPGAENLVDAAWAPLKQIGRLTLISDGKTLVSVVGVRPPKALHQEFLRLPEGDYEIVGTRAGYRDVKWLVYIAGDERPREMSVVCTVPGK